MRKFVPHVSVFFILAAITAILVLNQAPAPAAVSSDALQPRPLAPQAQGGSVPITGAQPASPAQQVAVITGQDTQHDVSPALRDLPVPHETPATTQREIEGPVVDDSIPVAIQPRPQVQDPALQSSFGSGRAQTSAGSTGVQALAPVSGVNFEGINNIDGVYPPDTNGDVGPNNYVQIVNLHFAVYSKAGALLYGPAANNSLWTGFGGTCQTSNDGDPVVLYDKIADRWILSQFTATSPYGECVAVSTGPDPTGTYFRYFFQFSTSVFYDYPKLGIWPDGYYLTANRFTSTFQGAAAIVLNRTAMLSGAAASFQQFNLSGTLYGSVLPASLDGSTLPPAGSPNYLAEIGASALHLWQLHVNWTTPSASTLSGPATLPVAAYNQLCPTTRSCVPQPGTSVGLDGLGDRLMHRLAYRNFGDHEALVVTHSVNAASSGTKAGLRWYEIRNPATATSVYQQGTYSPDANGRWMGSIAMDHVGDLAIGFSVSSSSVSPGIRYTGQLVGDPLGTLTQPETSIIAGSGSQTGSANRWGDYAAMAVDPVDDCTFWFTTEYLASTGTAPWQTRIASFRFPSCSTTAPTPTPTATTGPSPTATNTPLPPTATNTSLPPTATNTPLPATATFTPTVTRTPTATRTPLPPTATFTPTVVGACPNLSAGYCRTDTETRTWISGATNTGLTGDDQVLSFNLPFTFTFFGTGYTTLRISSNGNLHFGSASAAYSNVAIPNTGLPNALIAPFWDDLYLPGGGAVYTAVTGAAPNRVYTVEWRGVPHYAAGSNGVTFEVQLTEGTNQIWMLYQDTTFGVTSLDNGASATSGIENAAGTAGNAYSYNQPVLTPGKVLHFYK